ncbi:MAG: GAF domain-containing protein [Armatimonadetes bacterium]|nr:GAF domain-containing protein [Armatimonadota bacterium]
MELLDALSATSEEELIVELGHYAIEHTSADSVEMYVAAADEKLVLGYSSNMPTASTRVRLGKGVGLCGSVFESGTPKFLPSGAAKHPNFMKVSGLDDREYESAAALPLRAFNADLGVILLRWENHQNFAAKEKHELEKLAHDLAKLFEGYRRAARFGNQSSRLEALSEVSKTLDTSPYLEEILQLLVNLTASQFNYKVCTVRLLDAERGELVLRATQAPARAYQRKGAIKLGQSIAGRAIDLGKPVIVADVLEEESYIGHDLAREQGLRSMICVPLLIHERPVGVMSCYTEVVREFSADEVRALETLAKQAAVSIEHARLQVRTTLMQEMHHRVKNSLQQIASLLRLQSRFGKYKDLEEALDDSVARILAISAVHDLLSREDLDHVGVREIANMLVQYQQNSLIRPEKHIQFKVSGKGDEIHLAMAQATQVALVMNELIQNAVEHGFEVSDEGEIHVTIEQSEDQVYLWVSNSGDTVPPGYEANGRLGLRIISMFAKSLGGEFNLYERLGWTVAEFRFSRLSGE